MKNKEVHHFDKFKTNPRLEEAFSGIELIRNVNPELIIAVGGGSVIDMGKIITILASQSNDDLLSFVKNSELISNVGLPLIAIPTTIGTGSETTHFAVVYVDKIKYSVEGHLLKPDYFFLVPEFVVKALKPIKSSSGFDCISQSMESLISKKSSQVSLKYAKKSLSLSLESFLSFLNKPNKNNSINMSLAANLSGKAISISKTTGPHAISYPFTAHYGISHGHAVSLTLEKFLKFNFKNIKYSRCNFDLKKRYDLLFKLTKTKNIDELCKFIKTIKKLAKLECNFSKLGIDIEAASSKIISEVNSERLSNNPVKIKNGDLRNILIS